MDRGSRRLVAWSMLGAGTLVLTYLLMVRLGAGQWLDDVALDGRKSTRLAARRAVAAAVRLLTPAAVVVVTGWSVVVAARLRGVAAALAAGAATLATVALARVLKSGLPRDDRLVESFVGPENSYPSGHTAVAVTLALMAISVSPPRWRAAVTTAAVVAIGFHTVGMAGTGWHRPSDLVGGIGLAVMVSAIASLVVVRSWRGTVEDPPSQWFADSRRAGIVVGLAVAISLSWYVVIRLLGTSSYGSFKAHLVLTLATVGLAVGVVVAHSRLVDAADLGRVRRPVLGSGRGEH